MSQHLKDEVKQRIIDSALKIFKEHGYNKTTIKMISKESGVSVGNIYRYFKNKKVLFDELFQNVYNGIYKLMTKEIAFSNELAQLSSIERFNIATTVVIDEFVVLFRDNKAMFNIILQGEKGEHYEKIIGMVLEIIKNNMFNFWSQDDEIKAVTEIEISALANSVIFGTIDIINKVDDDELDKYLKAFLQRLVKGYFLYSEKD